MHQNVTFTFKAHLLCFHRAFIYNEKDQDCSTAAANTKTETILRRTSTALYEKNSKSFCLFSYISSQKSFFIVVSLSPIKFGERSKCTSTSDSWYLASITLWLMFCQCCVICDVWTGSANTVKLTHIDRCCDFWGWNITSVGSDKWFTQRMVWCVCPPDKNQIRLILLNDQTCYADSVLWCVSVLSSLPPGVCKWFRNRLQRNKVQNKNREALSEMGSKIPTQTQVCIHASSSC